MLDGLMASESLQRLNEQITPIHVFLTCGVLGVVVVIVGTCSMFSTSGPLPPPRDPPPAAERSAVLNYRYKEGFFKALVQEDAEKYKLKKLDFKRVKAGNRLFVEFTGNQSLKVGGRLETRRLLLQTLKQRVWVGPAGQGMRSAHMVLAITNKTDRYLAYRVLTEAWGACRDKGAIAHDAIALRPRERLLRTECLLRAGSRLKVLEVEVMEVSPVGYYYVSRLDPVQIRLNPRTAEGHEIPLELPQCRLLPWREIKNGMRRGEVRWRDVIDFYSRHNCDEYSFFVEYRYDPEGPERLPAIPPRR
jgi:hypothetical protein